MMDVCDFAVELYNPGVVDGNCNAIATGIAAWRSAYCVVSV